MLDRHDTYDWLEAFTYANFSIDDVETVFAEDEGENDGENWISFGRLKDGRYYFLAAGCDYTGWDCQASGHSFESFSREEVERFGMGDYDRERLRIVLPDHVGPSPIPDIED